MVLTTMAGFKTPRLRGRLIYPVRRCDCGRLALYRLRVRQYDAGLLRPHHASLYLCERCYRSELEACDLSGAHLPIVTLLGPPHKHLAD